MPPSRAGAWWLAMRHRTLTAAVAPVLVGSALAYHDGAFRPAPALAALVGALLIQVGTNLSNDVLDYRRGADQASRVGPTRVVQAGLLSERSVAAGAGAAYVAAAVVGLYLVRVAGWPIMVVGAAGIAAGVLYTAGPYPLAYVGLGDLFVLLFFGLAAVAGTYYVQATVLTPASVWLGVAVGALSVAILTVNNLRDICTDRSAGKRTLAVRLGAQPARAYYVLSLAVAFAVPTALWLVGALGPTSLLVWAALPLALPPLARVRSGASGVQLNRVLAQTARLQLVHAGLLGLGLMI